MTICSSDSDKRPLFKSGLRQFVHLSLQLFPHLNNPAIIPTITIINKSAYCAWTLHIYLHSIIITIQNHLGSDFSGSVHLNYQSQPKRKTQKAKQTQNQLVWSKFRMIKDKKEERKKTITKKEKEKKRLKLIKACFPYISVRQKQKRSPF